MSGKFKRVLEIGSYFGFSTEAFTSALDMGMVDEVHLVEPFARLELLDLIQNCKRKEHVHLHKIDSVSFLRRDTAFDLVFIDGRHSLHNVKSELEYLLPADIHLVVAHDTGSAGRHPDCFGPMHIKHEYQKTHYCLEDSLFREGEQTERSLFVACKTLELYRMALEGYRSHC